MNPTQTTMFAPVAKHVPAGWAQATLPLAELVPLPARPNPDSVYASDPLVPLVERALTEQHRRWEFITAGEAVLKLGRHPDTHRPLGPREREFMEQNLARLRADYEATWSELADAADPECAEEMRKRLESEARP